MQIVIHTGAHFTEVERLVKCLLRNKEDFASRGVAVPGPSRYRKLLRETFAALKTTAPAEGARDVLLDAILDAEEADRLILSHPHIFGAPLASVRNGRLYPNAVERMVQLSQLFPHDQIEMFTALRNPATFLPAVFGESPRESVEDFLGVADPADVRWSDMLNEVREAAPNVNITVWCNEDTPLIWAEIIREMAGLEHNEKIIGGFDLLGDIMSPEGMKRFRAYLKTHSVMTEMQKRRVIAAFLDKYALEDEIEEELDMPGWTDDLVHEMTEIYDEDVFRIQRIPGVTLIAP
ncbi:hypothetical protein [Pseudosulfitobacter sp. DSM 107133]|jgi:hypothetical protein|uniref:hypothetical protein n=1 Tax=Pseudosulfitobacter sp. DSM 107133 TaxID=2883100 RepID=UPI000DF1ACB2|nr:hypothetical protein [Pseudosulfitobacter sp. DSM 107133]UOA27755.1 hypothetical protein DSM107133_02492 [Pseudosulfitobacter sp. DSM 107133]